MFRLSQYFIKETLVSFYKQRDKYVVQKKIVKNNKVLSSENFEFDEDEFKHFIKMCFIENTQTYISTIIDTFNQGCVDSCSHTRYKEIGINLDNIKILCLKDYSIFIGLYEINQFHKEMKKFDVDYIFSPYLLIDQNKKDTKNSLYILYTENFVIVVIYEDAKKPKYSNIYQFKFEEAVDNMSIDDSHQDDSIDAFDDIDDLVDDIEEIDDIENLDDTLDDDIGDIGDIEDEDDNDESDNNIQNELIDVKNEMETVEFIKNSIKDYYESYSDNFLENVYILYDNDISNKFVKNIEDETFLDIQKSKIDILTVINNLSLKEINV